MFKVIAVSEHKDIKETHKYCGRFNRKGKADSVIAGLPAQGGKRTKPDEPPREDCQKFHQAIDRKWK